MFQITSGFLPPPPNLKSPLLWGTEERIRELFGKQIVALQTTRRNFAFRFRSAEEWLDFHRNYFGPLMKVYEMLNDQKRQSLTRDLLDLVHRYNRSGDDTVIAPSDYLEIVATKR